MQVVEGPVVILVLLAVLIISEVRFRPSSIAVEFKGFHQPGSWLLVGSGYISLQIRVKAIIRYDNNLDRWPGSRS